MNPNCNGVGRALGRAPKQLQRITAATLLAISAFAAEPLAPTNAPAPTRKLTFFDDFSGDLLDRTKWRVIITGRTVNNEQQAYIDSTNVLYLARGEEVAGATNGALVIRPRFQAKFTSPQNREYDFVSGRMDSRGLFEFTYGTASARIKMSAGAGLWPAFWLLGAGAWPATGEIDIMEYVGDKSWTSVAVHGPGYSGNTPIVKREPFPAAHDATEWHIYSVDWTRDQLTFKVDDREIYTATRAMIEKYGTWALDNPKHIIVNFALGGGYPQGVNGVRAPYPGLPLETVDLIKESKAAYLVDWVRVEQTEP